MGKETPGGEWIKRDVDIHRCNKPPYDRTIKSGDEWQCKSCRTIWRVKKIEYGVQWDPMPPAIVWEKVEPFRDSSGMYAPGTR